MTMELETLEILFDANTAKMDAALEKIWPKVESIMSKIEDMTGNSMKKTEDSMNIDKGVTQFSKQLEKASEAFEKVTNNLENMSKKSSDTIGTNLSSGIEKARPKVSKEVDAMLNEINAKMSQASAAQNKIAYLQSQRPTVSGGNSVKIDSQIANAQASMAKYQDQARVLAKSLKQEFDAVPSSLENIAKTMDSNEVKFNLLRESLKGLQKDYQYQQKPVGSFDKGFKNVDTPDSLKTAQKMQAQSDAMQKLARSNDVLQKEYQRTEERAEALRNSLGRINTVLNQSSMSTGSAARGVTMTGSGMKQSEEAVSRYGGVFSRVSNAISHGFGTIGDGFKNSTGLIGKFGSLFSGTASKVSEGTQGMTNRNNAFLMSMRYLLPSLIVYQLLGGAIRALSQGFFAALNTNQQFSDSLNQIKVNLMTAFYPIYTAILPAINTLMSALATLTGQFASFIAGVFGKTYQSAKQGASGLYQNVQALNDTGSSATKAKEKVEQLQRSLMGFDEIHRIGLQDKPDDSDSGAGGQAPKAPGVDFNKAMGNYSTPQWMKDIQSLLKDFFKPFEDAWKNQGQKVIDAWKYALKEVIGLASSIGKSFMEVWTNGTGQKFIENLLILLADVLNIIGDIAKAFKDAWNDDNRGTKLIQSLFDGLNKILEMLHSIAQSFRNAWNDGTGEKIAANLLDIITNIFKTVGNLAGHFKKAWDQGNTGQKIFSVILGIINDLLGHLNNMTKATADWAKTLDFTPLLNSIKKLLENIRPLADNIGGGLEWFYKNVLLPLAGFTIQKVIPDFLDALGSAIKVVNSVIDALKPLGKWLWDSFLQPLAKWTGGQITNVLKGLSSALDGISKWIDKNQGTVETCAKVIIGFFAFKAATAGLNGGIGVLGSIADKAVILAGKEGAVKKVFEGVTGIGDLKEAVTNMKTLAQLSWNGIKDGVSSIASFSGKVISTGADVAVATGKLIAHGARIAIDTGLMLANAAQQALMTAATVAWNVVAGIATGVTTAFGAAIAFLTSPIGLVVLAIGAAIAIGVLIYKNWDTIKTKAIEIWGAISDWFGKTLKGIGDFFSGLWKGITNTFSSVGKWFSDRFNEALTAIKNVFGAIGKWFSDRWSDITKAFSNVGKWFSDVFSGAWRNITNAFSSVGNWFSNRWNDITRAFSSVGSWFGNVFSGAWTNVKNVFSSVGSFFGGVWDTITNKFSSIGSAVGDAVSGAFKTVVNSVLGLAENTINGFISLFNSAIDFIDKIPGVSLGTLDYVELPRLANGGIHKGGPALVNDGIGNHWQEMYRTPSGMIGLFPKIKNLMVDLPSGTQVLSGPNTAKAMTGTPAYSSGIGSINNLSNFNTLQMPKLFDENPVNTKGFSESNNANDVSGFGLANTINSLTNAIMMLLQSLGAQANQAPNGDIVINIGGREFGRIAVSEINKYHRQLGHSELNI